MNAKIVMWVFVTLIVGALRSPRRGAPSADAFGQRSAAPGLKAFDNADGAIFNEDGRFAFKSSSAELGMPS